MTDSEHSTEESRTAR